MIWAKPTGDEKENYLERLDNVEVKFCAVCMSEDDGGDWQYKRFNINVSWTQCSMCDLWLHDSCYSVENIYDDEFFCKNCV